MIGSIITRGYGLEPGYVITRGFSTGLEVVVPTKSRQLHSKASGGIIDADFKKRKRRYEEAILRDDDEIMQIVSALMEAANGVFI